MARGYLVISTAEMVTMIIVLVETLDPTNSRTTDSSLGVLDSVREKKMHTQSGTESAAMQAFVVAGLFLK